MDISVKSAARAAAAFALSISAVGAFGGAVANANSGHEVNADVKIGDNPPASMKLVGSPDEQIRMTGFQGVVENADQGIVESADQCTDTSTAKVDCVKSSSESTPQFKAK